MQNYRSHSKELLFFIENYTGRNIDVQHSWKTRKHANTYINRFTINEDDQFDIAKIEEMDSDWEFMEGNRPDEIQGRMNELIRKIKARSLDIFLFGWYEFEGKTDHAESEETRYKRRIYIDRTLQQGRFHHNAIIMMDSIIIHHYAS